jgi:hypothetical protein
LSLHRSHLVLRGRTLSFSGAPPAATLAAVHTDFALAILAAAPAIRTTVISSAVAVLVPRSEVGAARPVARGAVTVTSIIATTPVAIAVVVIIRTRCRIARVIAAVDAATTAVVSVVVTSGADEAESADEEH